MHVHLDPGHGGSAPGVLYGTLPEKTANLATALTFKWVLAELGHRVTMSRYDDRTVHNGQRVVSGADVVVSLHYDSTPGRSLIYYPAAGISPAQSRSTIVAAKLAKALDIPVWPSTASRFGKLYIDHAQVPCVLYEVDRLSDYQDDPVYRTRKAGLFLGALLSAFLA